MSAGFSGSRWAEPQKGIRIILVPVIASRIAGLMGTLGDNYPGYLPVGDTRALARLLKRVECDPEYYLELKERCTRLFPLVDPKQERESWEKILRELSE